MPFDPKTDAVNEPAYRALIGQRVQKARAPTKTPKPFKSGSKVNTVKDVILWNPSVGKFAGVPALHFAFVEDDSFVRCAQCVPVSSVELDPQ
jgi:hypothetical protein